MPESGVTLWEPTPPGQALAYSSFRDSLMFVSPAHQSAGPIIELWSDFLLCHEKKFRNWLEKVGGVSIWSRSAGNICPLGNGNTRLRVRQQSGDSFLGLLWCKPSELWGTTIVEMKDSGGSTQRWLSVLKPAAHRRQSTGPQDCRLP